MYRAVPPVPTQGSIITPVYFSAIDAELPAVILTPTCDVEQNNWSYLTCVALQPFPGTIGKQILRGKWGDLAYAGKASEGVLRETLTPGQVDSLRKKVRSLMDQKEPRFHWFDPWAEGGQAHIADFQLVTSMTKMELDTVKQVAYLNTEYLESLPARYVSYMGRIGTPDRIRGVEVAFADQLVKSEFPAMQPVD